MAISNSPNITLTEVQQLTEAQMTTFFSNERRREAELFYQSGTASAAMPLPKLLLTDALEESMRIKNIKAAEIERWGPSVLGYVRDLNMNWGDIEKTLAITRIDIKNKPMKDRDNRPDNRRPFKRLRNPNYKRDIHKHLIWPFVVAARESDEPYHSLDVRPFYNRVP